MSFVPDVKASNLIIELDEGWSQIYSQGILKLHRLLSDGKSLQSFPRETYVELYTYWSNYLSETDALDSFLVRIVYQMCTQKQPKCWTSQLYDRYQVLLFSPSSSELSCLDDSRIQ